MVAEGTVYIDDVGLLEDDLVLLTIRKYSNSGYGDPWCRELNVTDGNISDDVSCEDYSDNELREWSTGDVDPSQSTIDSITMDESGSNQLIVSMVRNEEQFSVDLGSSSSNLFNNTKTDEDLVFQYFTVNSIFTTFIIVTDHLMPWQFVIFAVEFGGSDSNTYNVFEVSPVGEEWFNFDASSTSQGISVFESVNQLKLPLVCCLCSSSFTAKFKVIEDSTTGKYNLSLSDSKWGVVVDAQMERAYDWGMWSSSLSVYDLKDGSVRELTADLSTDSAVDRIRCSTFFGLIPIFVWWRVGII